MKHNLKNKYFFLRHGKNIHQAELKDIIYCYPDDETPCSLIEEGISQAKDAGEKLKDKKIEHIYCSDILRTRQTAKIVAEIIDFDENKIIYDARLRDINWGIFGGKHKDEAWAFYGGDKIKKFNVPTPQGETWNDCRERMKKVLNDIESNFENKNILIISHGDPLWLLEGYIKDISDEELLDKRGETLIQTGEVREVNK
jgi:broad specificity phosphatase PhoE